MRRAATRAGGLGPRVCGNEKPLTVTQQVIKQYGFVLALSLLKDYTEITDVIVPITLRFLYNVPG